MFQRGVKYGSDMKNPIMQQRSKIFLHAVKNSE